MKRITLAAGLFLLLATVVPSGVGTGSSGLALAATCGDVVDNDGINISDLVFLVSYMFNSGPAPSPDVCLADVNGSGGLPDISDLVDLVNFMFNSGPAPATNCCPDCFDGQTEPCYTGPSGTEGVGICAQGTRTCSNGAWGPCVGEQLPQNETCDGLDNDCNGVPDDNIAPMPCPLQDGACFGAMMVCVNGAFQCDYSANPDWESVETRCDGVDNDCDGLTDEMCDGLPNVAGYGCSNDTCIVVSCDPGWANCDGFTNNGCEFDLAANTGCGSGFMLGSLCGDEPDGPINRSDVGHKWHRIQVDECNTNPLSSSDFDVRFVLTSPAGMNYDLKVYYNCTLVGQSTAPAGSQDVVHVTWNDDLFGDDSRQLEVEVDYVSGQECSPWGLQIHGLGQK